MDFTSDTCWFLLIKTLLIKNNKKREAALKDEAGGDEKHVFFFFSWSNGKRPIISAKLLIGTTSVDSCSKWDASNAEWKFQRGCARFISMTF